MVIIHDVVLRQPQTQGENKMEAYCVKCKAKRVMADVKKVTMKNGKPASKGKCPKCGTGMYRIG